MHRLRLSFDASGEDVAPTETDGDQVMSALLQNGVKYFELEVDGLATLRLPVEDDAIFVMDAAAELGALDDPHGTHLVYLGDGELEVDARREGAAIVAKVRHAPNLQREQATETDIRVPIQEYRRAWHALAMQLRALAGLDS